MAWSRRRACGAVVLGTFNSSRTVICTRTEQKLGQPPLNEAQLQRAEPWHSWSRGTTQGPPDPHCRTTGLEACAPMHACRACPPRRRNDERLQALPAWRTRMHVLWERVSLRTKRTGPHANRRRFQTNEVVQRLAAGEEGGVAHSSSSGRCSSRARSGFMTPRAPHRLQRNDVRLGSFSAHRTKGLM